MTPEVIKTSDIFILTKNSTPFAAFTSSEDALDNKLACEEIARRKHEDNVYSVIRVTLYG